MKRYFLFVCTAAFILTIGNSFVFAQVLKDKLHLPTGTMTLAAPEGYKAKKTPVVFSHSLHFTYSCKSCHHTWDTVEPVKSCSAAGCHEEFWPSKPDGKVEDAISLTAAYHQACRDCHRDELKTMKRKNIKDAEKMTGPIECDGCHPKEAAEVEDDMAGFYVPLGNILLEAPEGAETKRTPVDFPHDLHFGEAACIDCHHEWDGESEIQSCSAEDCHDQVEPDPATRNINDDRNIQYYLAAYHKACLYCHRDLKKEHKSLAKIGVKKDKLPAYGPVACVGCHKKEE